MSRMDLFAGLEVGICILANRGPMLILKRNQGELDEE